MILVAALFLSSGPDTDIAKRIMASFGYPAVTPGRPARTASGGLVFEGEGIVLRVDSQGRPRNLKIRGVKFESSKAPAAKMKLKHLLQRYPLNLPQGQWMTARPGPGIPFGHEKSSFRYHYVPTMQGHPFLNCSQMTVQFSSDLKRVIEWSYHVWPVRTGSLPARILLASDALGNLTTRATARIAGLANTSMRVNASELKLGWIHMQKPRLVYVCPIEFRRKLSHSIRGVYEMCAIDAGTGAPVTWH